MKEQTIDKFLTNKLFSLLQHASEEQVAELSRGLRLSPSEVDTLTVLANEVRKGASESLFQEKLKTLKDEAENADILSFRPPSQQEQRETQDRFDELVRGKRVALVGPANDASTDRGARIDSHDLIVRINFQFPVSPELAPSIGSRTDILYHCCNGDYLIDDILCDQFSQLQYVCFQRNIDSRKLRAFAKTRETPVVDMTSLYDELGKKMNTPVSTGTVALFHLLQSPLKELSLFGFSIFQTPYHPTYRGDGSKAFLSDLTAPEQVGPHRVEPHIIFWRQLIRDNRRVVLEPLLSEIINR